MLQNIGLILEGGGMRGAYTAGVLDAFFDNGIKFSYIIGVSAGANNGANFVAEQRGRSKKVFVDHVRDERYMGLKNLIREGSYFGMDFLFDLLPNKLEPFDYETFYNSPVCFKVCVTDCESGQPVYIEHKDYNPRFFMEKVLRASSSLPFISQPVEIGGRKYLDGGMTDSIPINKAIEDGNPYNVIVLTRNKGYRKEPSRFNFLTKIFLRKFPELIKRINNRYLRYNKCLDYIEQLERAGRVFIFRPVKKIVVERLERDIEKLRQLYEQGYDETIKRLNDFKDWLDDISRDSTTG